ncbi:VOC family protein [Sphaerisporangium flaviroseum]|uniref:VOC family protein n=1 Tax=Sphaerisporangium flaviroseum TaxID=509199 RepID=A0ABP7HP61_9ACTN
MITKISNVVLYVADQQRSVDFYVKGLGFELATDAEMGPGARWIEVVPPGAETRFTLCDAAHFETTPGSSTPPTLSCDDVHSTYETLKANGVEVSEPVTEPWATWIKVTDPDGHEFVVSAA